ncbi:MAG: hypothetical protein RR397_04435 [Odoribacter sp.]
MKRTFFMGGWTVVVLSFFLSGCNSMKKLQREVIETAVVGYVSPEQLEAVNGVVNFTYSVNFAPKEFEKRMILKITPRFQYGNHTQALKPVFLQGKRVKGSSYPVVDYVHGSSFKQAMSFDYKPGMEKGVLWADIEAMRGKKSFMMSPVILNKKGIRVWQQPSFSLDGVDYVPALTETFVGNVPAEAVGVISGYVMFPLGEATISQAEQHSAVMTQAAKAMKQVLSDKKATITNLFIYVSNSPEGAEQLNKNLGVSRFKAAKCFFEKDLQLANTPMVKNPKFILSETVSENWQGLYLLLENSTIKNKGQIISDLKAEPDAAKRNAVIDRYIAKVPELKEVILPVLRRADFYIFYVEPTAVAEDVELVYYVPQLSEKVPAVSVQTNWQLLNDLAVVALQNKENHKAQKLLEAALVLKQDATVQNNLGVVSARAGNAVQATQLFSKAQLRKEARYNMGLLLMQQGNYGKAISYLKEMPGVNLAYAQLMNNDNRGALESFRQVAVKNAQDYYMMAVAAARINNVKDMAAALAKAVQLDPTMKKKAVTDVSFYPYKGNAVFMQVIQ